MLNIDAARSPTDLLPKIRRMWDLSAEKIYAIERSYDPAKGAPVYTVDGAYTTRGWTEWTQGFQYGSAILQFDATGETEFLDIGRAKTVAAMAPHVTHMGVHDHGFNNVSTYGNLLRLIEEGRIKGNGWMRQFCALALKCSGAVQARRWTALPEGGFIYSFNGPHSLFADTVRSLRALGAAYKLGHVLMEEGDRKISLLDRLVQHARATADYSVYYGEGRDAYDVPGRVAHESVFNLNDGAYRCASTQQGYSPFTTWTRGLAWIICGFAEQLEFVASLQDPELDTVGGREALTSFMLRAAKATCDFYIAHTPIDGIPYWDTGAPGLAHLHGYLEKPADPYNHWEPVDSSAAAIAAQGLLRLGRYLEGSGEDGQRYWAAGLTVLDRLLEEPYLSVESAHQGLLLHSVYHRPKGWDHIPEGHRVPCGESSMWGDYHLREAALYVQRIASASPYLTYWRGTDEGGDACCTSI